MKRVSVINQFPVVTSLLDISFSWPFSLTSSLLTCPYKRTLLILLARPVSIPWLPQTYLVKFNILLTRERREVQLNYFGKHYMNQCSPSPNSLFSLTYYLILTHYFCFNIGYDYIIWLKMFVSLCWTLKFRIARRSCSLKKVQNPGLPAAIYCLMSNYNVTSNNSLRPHLTSLFRSDICSSSSK